MKICRTIQWGQRWDILAPQGFFAERDRNRAPEIDDVPGLYAVGLPWLTKHLSATLSVVSDDAEFVAGQIAAR